MKTFKFIWKDGKEETAQGINAADAFRRLGYGGGALAALDYWKELVE